MQRTPLNRPDNWQQKVESVGLTFHTLENGTPYWDETAAYQFTAAEIDTLEAAGNTLQEMSLAPPRSRPPLRGRVRRLPVHRRRDRHSRSRRQPASRDFRRRRPAHHRR